MPRYSSDQPDAQDMLRAITSWILERVGGIRVGIVDSYDQVQRVAVVQPVRRRRIFGTPQSLPTVRAPVGWWRFGTMVFLGEVQAGDEVLLVTCEREIWPWYTLGQQHDPTSERMHDPSDSIALPWISSIKRAITARVPGTFFMGREDATAGVTITQGPAPGRITIEGTGPASIQCGSTAVSPALMGTETLVALNAYAATMTGAVNALNTLAQAWAGLPGVNQVAYATGHAAFLTAVTGAQTALAAALTASLATKTVVE